MKKALIFCTLLVAMCSLAFADVDNINKATAATMGPNSAASIAQPGDVKAELARLESQILAIKASGLEPDAGLYTRMYELIEQLNPSARRGTLDVVGGEACGTAYTIPAIPFSDSGLLGTTDDCVGRPFNDLFYVYTVVVAGAHRFDMCPSPTDQYLKVYTDGICCTGVFSYSDDECGVGPDITLNLIVGQVVVVEVGTYTDGAAPDFVFNLTGPSADRGSCCYIPVGGDPCNPACLDGVFQADCDVLAGTFSPNGTCATNPCPTPLAGDLICNAIPYVLGSCVDGTTLGYTNNYDAVCNYTGSTAPDVVYSFAVSAPAAYTFSLCQGLTDYDTKLYLLASDGVTVVACNDDICTAPLFASPYVSRFECVNLAVGSYYVVVDGFGTALGNYTLCSSICAACPQECPVGGRPEGEPCPNIPDTYNTGCNDASGNYVFSPIGCNDVVCGLYESGQGDPGLRDTDWYLLTVMDRESLTVSVVGEVASGLILVQAPCPGTTLASVGVAACSTATISRCLAPGDYYIIVVPNVTPAVCSRYTLTTHCEPCAPEPTCDFPNRDVEPNDDCLGAQAVDCGGYYCGAINPSGDDDYYMITIPTGSCGILHVDIFANATPGYYPFGLGLDSWVYLWAADCATQVGFDDDGGVGFDSHLDSPCLPAGTYFLDVGGYGDAAIGPYVMYVACEPCVCPCVGDVVSFDADNSDPLYADGWPAYDCAVVCEGQPLVITVWSHLQDLDPAKFPYVSVVPGCEPVMTHCDSICQPGSIVEPMGIIFPGAMWVWDAGRFTLTLTGLTSGCVCVSLEGFLSAEMGNISAVAGDANVRLDWNTLSEAGVEMFQIERAVKGSAAELIGSVTALGSQSNGHSYSYTDNAVANGTTYVYTLVVVNVDGTREAVETTIEATPSINAAVISEYKLHQNFPNPFNPSTSIMFDMVDAGFVSLKVYNTLGQEVTTVVNGSMDAGRHIVTFDANTLTSGMYLYRLEANGFSAQMKMLLMK